MSSNVVTRFAPSPTGYLHVGAARTALFNWLYARHTGGVFILRIEDTDQKRNTPAATQQVLEDLRWLGIDWDQGPEVGGPLGPYFQSQRKDIYQKYIRQLLEQKKAYYCFETSEQLEQMRSQAHAQKKGFSYPRPSRFPSEAEAEEARAAGRPVTVRFAVPHDQPVIVEDIVRGKVTFDPREIGDFIIQKSDGLPTYNFACVVDDCLMQITHVIRGQEHLTNTPAQQLLWQALFPDRPLPVYAHMSVTVSETGGKLSKRQRPQTLRQALLQMPELDRDELARLAGISTQQLEAFLQNKASLDMPVVDAIAENLGIRLPEINIVDFFKSGYLPETMVNFLALLGWNPGDNREIMSRDELIAAFELNRLTKSNCLFDRKKLLAFNTEHIRTTPPETLLSHFKAYLKAVNAPAASADDQTLARVLKACAGSRTLAEIEQKSRFLFIPNDQFRYDQKAVEKVLLKDGALEVLAAIREHLAHMDQFTEENIETMLRTLAEQRQLGLGKVAQPLRVAITGSTVSPPIFDSVCLLGKASTLARIDLALQKFTPQTRPEQT